MPLYVASPPMLAVYASWAGYLLVMACVLVFSRRQWTGVQRTSFAFVLTLLALSSPVIAQPLQHPCGVLKPDSWAWLLAMCWLV